MTTKFSLFCAGLGLAGLLLLGGCSKEITAEKIRDNPSPELESIARTSEQRENMHARAVDTNLRQVWDDLDSIFFLDRPMRMSRYPIP